MLSVWLPLNGDLRNQGLSNITATNNGATVDNNGKIGKCYSFDGNDDFISISCPDLYNTFSGGSQPFSIAFWVYHADTTRAIIFGDYGLSKTIGFNVELTTGHQVRFYWNGTPDKVFNVNASVGINTWTHIIITYDGDEICIYKNGVQQSDKYSGTLATKSKTSGVFYLGRDYRTGATVLNGKLNDFRIYDHCLSPRECKQVSTALVLHYPLNRGGFGVDNLLVNTDFSGVSKKYTLKSGSEGGFWFPPTSWERNTEYTVSCRLRGNANMNLYLISSSGNYSLSWVNRVDLSTTDYRFFSITFTSRSDRDVSNLYICTRYGTSNSSVGDWFEIAPNSLKFEKGSTATPWVPAPSDDLYSSMGLDNNIEYDVSGYNHNGTKNGVFTYDSDTPKYNTSTIFNGSDNCIKFPFNDFCTNGDVFTMNIWWKKTELGSKNFETLIGGPSGFEMDTRAGSAQALSLYMTSTRGGTLYSPFNMNEWYMITLVNDGTNELYYVNGVLIKTIEKKNMPTGNYYVGAWHTEAKQNFQGNMSDFRIYKTALSAEDVYNLYAVGASLSDTGVLFSNEVSEV